MMRDLTITQEVARGRTIYYVEERHGQVVDYATMWDTKQQAQAYARLLNRGFDPHNAERIVRQAA
jgi:SOS response regulatory protein OraA/RecX